MMSLENDWHVKGLSSKRTSLKVDVLEDRKIYCSQARPCIFQPGHFTGWGSEGVNGAVVVIVIVAAEKKFGEYLEKKSGKWTISRRMTG